MSACDCSLFHARKRVVVTGGPGAGKTAVLESVRQYFCRHVKVVPEAAAALFGAGFTRSGLVAQRAATQRAIFHVQRELEALADARNDAAIVLCDRGTVDGAAYWPGPGTLWEAVGTTHEQELSRYAAVLHLRTPDPLVYTRDNPLRVESAAEAALIDQRIADAWAPHPHCLTVDATDDFLEKVQRALALLRAELPACCRAHVLSNEPVR